MEKGEGICIFVGTGPGQFKPSLAWESAKMALESIRVRHKRTLEKEIVITVFISLNNIPYGFYFL